MGKVDNFIKDRENHPLSECEDIMGGHHFEGIIDENEEKQMKLYEKEQFQEFQNQLRPAIFQLLEDFFPGTIFEDKEKILKKIIENDVELYKTLEAEINIGGILNNRPEKIDFSKLIQGIIDKLRQINSKTRSINKFKIEEGLIDELINKYHSLMAMIRKK